MRSATAPLMSATVMTANISWKPAKARSGRPTVTVSVAEVASRVAEADQAAGEAEQAAVVAPKAIA